MELDGISQSLRLDSFFRAEKTAQSAESSFLLRRRRPGFLQLRLAFTAASLLLHARTRATISVPRSLAL